MGLFLYPNALALFFLRKGDLQRPDGRRRFSTFVGLALPVFQEL